MKQKIPVQINRVAVLGAGVMGAQIAAHLLNAGLSVILFDLASKEGDKNQFVKQSIEKVSKIKPNPHADRYAPQLIRAANYEEDLPLLKTCQWVIEAISEQLPFKQALYEKITPYLSADVIISSNTSGLSIQRLKESLSVELHARFCGVHFFNPPRYMPLVELIGHDATDPAVLNYLEGFLVHHLGKGVVRAKDTPTFIANRIGCFTLAVTLHYAERFGLSPDVVDQLTGPLIGRPKSATYRLMDVVGLDTLQHVLQTMLETLPDDPWRHLFALPVWMQQLINKGALGQKTNVGIYQKRGEDIYVYQPQKSDYRLASQKADPQILAVLKQNNWLETITALRASEHPQAQFLWNCFREIWAYSAYHLETIAETVREVDLAMRWGFGWEHGPFELWQQLSWSQITSWIKEDITSKRGAAAIALPAWVEKQAVKGGVYQNNGAFSPRTHSIDPPKTLPVYQRQCVDPRLSCQPSQVQIGHTLYEDEVIRLWSMGDKIPILSFKTKKGVISPDVLAGLQKAIDYAQTQAYGLVIWQPDTSVFSAGADLKYVRDCLAKSDFAALEHYLHTFRATLEHIRKASVPIVAAVSGLVLGGGLELMLHCHGVVATLETYCGFPEASVGMIPGAGGLREMARRLSHVMTSVSAFGALETVFKQIAECKVSQSAWEAKAMHYLQAKDDIIMNPGELLYSAKAKVQALSAMQFLAPLEENIRVTGQAGYANCQALLVNLREGQWITDHDVWVSDKIARVLCAAPLEKGSEVSEQWVSQLENQAILACIQHKETIARITHWVQTGKPLRN